MAIAEPKISRFDQVWLDTWSSILRQLIAVIREIEKDRHTIARTLTDDPKAVSRLAAFADGAQWWRYYELNEVAHAGLALLSFGVLPSTLRLILKGFGRGDLLDTLKENVLHLEPQPKRETHAFDATMSLGNSLRSRLICGEPLHALVKRADTDLDAFKLALRIDPLTCTASLCNTVLVALSPSRISLQFESLPSACATRRSSPARNIRSFNTALLCCMPLTISRV